MYWLIAASVGVVAALVWIGARGLAKSDCTSYEDTVPPDTAKRVVTLVHGTWPRGPLKLSETVAWYCAGSEICSRLIANGQPATVIQRLRWSGANSTAERLAASDHLKTMLLEKFQCYPQAKHFIIAHSHGGNIALNALRDISVDECITGAVFLATPFLHVSLRPELTEELKPGQEWFFQMLRVAVGLAVPLAAVVLLWHFDPAEWSAIPRPLAFVLIALWLVLSLAFTAAMIAVPIMLLVRTKHSWEQLYQAALTSIEVLQTTAPKNAQLLVVRAVADEASSALILGQFLAWLSGYLDMFMVRLFAPLVIAILIFSEIKALWSHHLVPTEGAGGDLLLWVAAPILALGLVAFSVRVLMALPFGLPLASHTALLNVSSEAAPRGMTRILQLAALPQRGFQHIAIHDDPYVAASVAEWLSSLS